MKNGTLSSLGIKNEPTLFSKNLSILKLVLVASILWLLPSLVSAQLSYSPSTGIAYQGQAQMSAGATGAAGSLTIISTSLPSGITISSTTGQISWDATVPVGHYNINVFDGTSTVTYNLNVIPNPDNFFTAKYSGSTVKTVQYGPVRSSNNNANVDVYLPTGDNNTQRPVLMFLHGGGFQSTGTKTESYVVSFCKLFATYGFVCFAPNYNETLVKAGHNAGQNLAALKDADSCLNWIRNPTTAATYNYNPEFLYFGGGSAGAHLSCNFAFADGNSWYNGFTPNIKNVIAFADCWGSSPVMSSSGAGDRLYNFSSLNANSLPTYMVQGSSDQTVPVQNGIDLNNALTAAGAIHDWWEIPGETHGCPGHVPQPIGDSMAAFFHKVWKLKYPLTVNAVVTPVKLVSFDAALSGSKVSISWTTATEINSSYFEVERSIDGKNFAFAGRVTALGNSSSNLKYVYSDDASALSGTVYYRLKSVDKDGAFTYSSIKSVTINVNSHLSVYPNPVKAGQSVCINYKASAADKVTVEVMDLLGRKVLTSNHNINEGSNTLSIATTGMKAGTYFLTISSNNQVIQKQKLVIE